MECKNCHSPLETHLNYCPNCGAKVIRNRLTIKSLFAHFSEQFLNYDNKFLQTFLGLFTKPEDVIQKYIDGTRKRYVNVISYFAIAITISGLQMYFLNKYFPELIDVSVMSTVDTEAMQKENLDFMQEYQSLLMMLYVPLYAAMSYIVFFTTKRYNYTEHLVIFMYISAQISIFGAVIMLAVSASFGYTMGQVAIFLMPVYILYSAYCLKRLYGMSLGGIILRTLFFLLILFIFILGIIMVIIQIANYGSFEEYIKAQQALQQKN